MRGAVREARALLVPRLLVSVFTAFINLRVLLRGIDVVIVAAVHVVVLPLGKIFGWVDLSCLLFSHNCFSHLVVIEASKFFLRIMTICICLHTRRRFHRRLMLFIGILIMVIFLFVVLIRLILNELVLSLSYGYWVSEGRAPLLLQRLLNFIGFKLHRRLLTAISISVFVCVSCLNWVLWLLVRLQLHEGIGVGTQLPNHMLLEKKVVSCCQMIVLIVFYWFEQAFLVESLLGLQVAYYFLV